MGRIVRMHASEMEDISDTGAGDIVALFGIDCASGDTFTDGTVQASMTSMFVPEPVIKLMIKPKDNKSKGNMSKALARFTKEDPTFRTMVDEETSETVIAGMGELHLDVYVERMKREYNAEVVTGRPQVAYREAITVHAPFDYTHKKQTGGSGQYGQGGRATWSPRSRVSSSSRTRSPEATSPPSTSPPARRASSPCSTRDPWSGSPSWG